MNASNRYQQLKDLLKKRILILDGGMGTMIQCFHLTEQDYRGDIFADLSEQQKGNNDLLSLTQPDIIKNIHRQYLEAGADIFTTNTFNANAISMDDYGVSHMVKEINLAAAGLARKVADNFMQEHPERIVFVAGSMGPTNKTASMSPEVNDPSYRSITYSDLYVAYKEQAEALLEGGIDIFLFETVFDTLNVKAGLEAVTDLMREKEVLLPIMLSVTLSGQGGRTFSGQTLAAFLTSIQHAPVISVGLNCSFGAAEIKPYLQELAQLAPYYISTHPNAGLPNSFGGYDETPDSMAVHVRSFIDEGLVNIIGGCCGTTPEHIGQYPELIKNAKPHIPVDKPTSLWLSGLELLEVKPENNFVNIGERCNVAGSRKFLRLIKEGSYEEALSIARKQVEDGAQVIDINMDDGMLDATKEMKTFLNLIASEPDIARVPVMIDSSKWEVIEEALQCVQGKSIVNSISLKEGEELFLQRAVRIKQLGAATVVMAFDEKGQADTFERKIEICERAYRLLTEKACFSPQDIIFDPNILAIATGIEEHNNYGLAFIQATEWIKRHLPGAKISGGVSNLSFSFRGNNYVREAIHAVFLYHAIGKGMDMGIVNPATTVLYEDIEPEFRTLLEDVILARRPEATEELIVYVQQLQVKTIDTNGLAKVDLWRELPVEERIEYALMKGVGDYLETDMHEALRKYSKAVDIIDGPLMSGMNKVGELFGAGKMFLPQVVKTARIMKKAVSILQPTIETEKTSSSTKAGKIVFATVKGDVHDIGKNIVSIVLSCNNYEVVDLGVMVPSEVIVKTVIEEKPDLLCLSGLITPSLEEMVHVADEMQKAGQTIPIMIGGATTSKLHTAVKIAPHYDYPVIHVLDASQNPLIAAKLMHPETRKVFVEELNQEQEALRASLYKEKKEFVSLDYARRHPYAIDWKSYVPVEPSQKGIRQISSISINDVVPYINWVYFFKAWKLNGRFFEIAQLHGCDSCRASWLASFQEEERSKAAEAMQLYKDAIRMLDRLQELNVEYCKALYGFFPANSAGDNLLIGDKLIPMLRQQEKNENDIYKSLVDYVMPLSEDRTDWVGVFAVTGGSGSDYLKKKYEEEGDSYKAILLQTLTDRLAEATAEYLYLKVRKEYWGYAPEESFSIPELFKAKYSGVRPAVGYPSLPDQSLNFDLNELLDMSLIDVQLTENGAMMPTASISGLFVAHPESDYFMIGTIDDEQFADYALRRGILREEAYKWLNKYLA